MRKEKVSDKEIELWKRIETERTIFRYRMLASSAREIYDNCNRIRFFECIYEYFQYAEDVEKGYINACLRCGDIIETLYSLYVKYEHLRCGTWREIDELMSALVEEQRRHAESFRQQTEGE